MRDIQRPPVALWALLASVLLLVMFARAAKAEEGDLECEGATHCVLMSLPRWHEDMDEPYAERWERLKEMADGLDAATDNRLKKSWLIMTAWKESRLARFVDLDWPKCREGVKGWCDGGRAAGVIQLHGTDRDMGRAEYFRTGLRTFERGANYCESRGFDRFEGGTSHYARGGRHCEWSKAKERVEMMWKIHWQLGRYE